MTIAPLLNSNSAMDNPYHQAKGINMLSSMPPESCSVSLSKKGAVLVIFAGEVAAICRYLLNFGLDASMTRVR
jgi:hypothetical protein